MDKYDTVNKSSFLEQVTLRDKSYTENNSDNSSRPRSQLGRHEGTLPLHSSQENGFSRPVSG